MRARLKRVFAALALVVAWTAITPASIAAPERTLPVASAEGSLPASAYRPYAALALPAVSLPFMRAAPRARFAGSRVVSLYGYPEMPVMGALGESSPEVAARRAVELASSHETAAPGVPTLGALHLVVAVAEPEPGPDGTYLHRLDHATIEQYRQVAREHDLLLYLDVQIGWGDPLVEAQRLEKFLLDPDVQLALDAEFATRAQGVRPGQAIGTLLEQDVNRVQHYLAEVVATHGLPAKMLVLHQFTGTMLERPEAYDRLPEIEIAIDMDGYGSPTAKLSNYARYALAPYSERPALKLFYRWDAPLLTPELLGAMPRSPGLVIYQ